MTIYRSTGNASEVFGSWDGFETIEKAQEAGWLIYSAWGAEGWDAGAWPLVIIGQRAVPGPRSEGDAVVESLYVVEGDVTIEGWATYQESERHLDSIVLWHWRHEGNGPSDIGDFTADTMPDSYRGPFRWHRVCVSTGEPHCPRCNEAGAVTS